MTDHYAKAVVLLVAADKAEYLEDGETFLAVAQVHATLALVEQQRIANLIALSEPGRHSNSGARAALAAFYPNSAEPEVGVQEWKLAPDIARALRIENTNEQ